jgi:anti-sigma factor RsiW
VTAMKSAREELDAGRRSRGAGCLSNLALDRYLSGELRELEREAVSTHLAACPTCADVYAVFKDQQDRFAGEPVAALAADALARAAERRPRFALPWLTFPALAAAGGLAALALLWAPVRQEVRTKGGFSLSPYVLHPERAATGSLHTGEPLHPGDRLQFRYNGARGGYLAVVAVDAAGGVSVYYPPGATAAPVEAGREVGLSSAVELDGSLGAEVMVAVRCDQPVAVSEVVRAARQAMDAARARGAAPTELGPLGLPCDETRHRIAKTERPAP